MQLKSFFLLSITTFCFQLTNAQINFGIEAKNYKYDKETKLYPVDPKDTSFSAVVLIDKTISELYFTDQYKGETLNKELSFEFKTYHKRIKLNNDDAVQNFNKMYISMRGSKVLLDIKARAINPDGTIIDFDKDNMKFVENFQNSGPYNIMALDGIQVGSEVEYIYTIQDYDDSFYGHIYLQGDYPKKLYSYELIYPDHLEYKAKSYNGCPEMLLDTLSKDKIRLRIPEGPVAAYVEEEVSADDANIQRVEYMLFGNSINDRTGIYSWKRASEEFTNYLYKLSSDPKLAKKEGKALQKIIKKDLAIPSGTKDKDIVMAIEQLIKSKYTIVGDEGSSLIHDIAKNKTETEYGALRLYIHLLEHFKINHQLVLTSNRFNKKFDGDFETYNFLEKYLIYFPEFDQFTDPAAINYRLGMIHFSYCYTNGLFLKSKEIGGVKAFFPEVKAIPGPPNTQSYDNMEASIQFDADFEKCIVFLQKESKGYNAAFVRPWLAYRTPDKKEEDVKETLKLTGEDTKVIEYKYSADKMEGSMLDKPFLVEGNVEMDHLIEKAGNNYLFKIGLIIGPQMEMYKEESRKFPVESRYNHGYKRVLKFTIPEGYKIKNLNDLKMDYSSSVNGKRTMEFVSNYTLKGNQLEVVVNEYYNEIEVPVSRYEEYRTVINAAADFNKIVLVLEKI